MKTHIRPVGVRLLSHRSTLILCRHHSGDHSLADRWTQAHAARSPYDRRWPRPNSPLASFDAGSTAWASAEEEEIALASLHRLPPVEDATSFDDYVHEVRTSFPETSGMSMSVAEQIKREAEKVRLTRRRAAPLEPLPRPGPLIDDDADAAAMAAMRAADPAELPQSPDLRLPAGRIDSSAPRPAASSEPKLRDAIANFDLTPRAVKAHLDEHVIAQDLAKRALSVAVCDHYNFARQCVLEPELAERHHVKPNVLLLGPSGVGKTHLMRALGRLLGVPFVKGDATKFSATGYVGGDVDDLLRSLVPAAGGDVPLAEYGIVYVDEVDKIADSPERKGLFGGGGGGVNTRDVQCALLKLMEDAEVNLPTPPTRSPPRLPLPPARNNAPAAPAVLRTRHVLFVFSGAFTGLEATLRKQHGVDSDDTPPATAAKEAGEAGDAESAGEAGGVRTDVLHLAGTSDLVRAGLEPEFVGRIPVRVACRHLTVDDLMKVLRDAKDSVAEQLVRDFAGCARPAPERAAHVNHCASPPPW